MYLKMWGSMRLALHDGYHAASNYAFLTSEGYLLDLVFDNFPTGVKNLWKSEAMSILDRFTTPLGDEGIGQQGLSTAVDEAGLALTQIGHLVEHLVARREEEPFTSIVEMWGMADGSWSNAFEFRGPESYHQLAEQFSELARLLAEADEKENHEG